MMKIVLAAVAVAGLSSAALAQEHAAHPGHENHAAPAAALPTIGSPIKDLLANPQTAAVLEEHLPGVGQHPALPQFQDMTLAEVAPYSQGMVTPAVIAAIQEDLEALPAE